MRTLTIHAFRMGLVPRYSGGAAGAGDGGTPAVNIADPAVKAAIDAAVASQVAGLKTNRDEILGEKAKLKEEFDALKASVAELGDLKAAKSLLETVSKSEEAKLIAEGKIDQVLDKRTESMRKDADTKVSAATKRVTELEAVIAERDTVIASLVIDSRVDEAIGKSEGVQPTARKDIRRAAREIFKVNKQYQPEARNAEGTLLMGKNGKDPLTPSEWLESMREENPHWWGTSAGGGAGGNSSVPSKGGRPSADQLNKMSGQQLLERALGGNR